MSDPITTLTMRFKTADDKKRSVNIQPCNGTVSEANAKALMDAMISSDAFVYQPSEKLGAVVTQRITTVLF